LAIRPARSSTVPRPITVDHVSWSSRSFRTATNSACVRSTEVPVAAFTKRLRSSFPKSRLNQRRAAPASGSAAQFTGRANAAGPIAAVSSHASTFRVYIHHHAPGRARCPATGAVLRERATTDTNWKVRPDAGAGCHIDTGPGSRRSHAPVSRSGPTGYKSGARCLVRRLAFLRNALATITPRCIGLRIHGGYELQTVPFCTALAIVLHWPRTVQIGGYSRQRLGHGVTLCDPGAVGRGFEAWCQA